LKFAKNKFAQFFETRCILNSCICR